MDNTASHRQRIADYLLRDGNRPKTHTLISMGTGLSNRVVLATLRRHDIFESQAIVGLRRTRTWRLRDDSGRGPTADDDFRTG